MEKLWVWGSFLMDSCQMEMVRTRHAGGAVQGVEGALLSPQRDNAVMYAALSYCSLYYLPWLEAGQLELDPTLQPATALFFFQ